MRTQTEQQSLSFMKNEENQVFKLPIEVATHPCLQHHRVFGVPLLPTDAYLELLFVICTEHLGFNGLCINDLVLSKPLTDEGDECINLDIVVRGAGGGVRIAVKSARNGRRDLHASAHVQPSQRALELSPMAELDGHSWLSSEQAYDGGRFFEVGPFYRSIRRLALARQEAQAELEPPPVEQDEPAFLLNPAVVNGGLMAALRFALVAAGDPTAVFVPVSIRRVEVPGTIACDGYRVSVRALRVSDEEASFDVRIDDRSGRTSMLMSELTVRRVRADDVRGRAARSSTPSAQAAFAPDAADTVAVVGFSGRFPGAVDTDAFWENLVQGVNSVSLVPHDRWNSDAIFDENPRAPGRTVSRWGAFLSDVDRFDAEFFGIAPVEARNMDPQQRLFLQEAYRAIEHAGQTPAMLAERRCGVFVGAANCDYEELLSQDGSDVTAHAFTGLSPAVLAGRVSYLLDLSGPALAVDTACSSSLTAFSLACQNIVAGDCDMALAGGVHVMVTPRLQIKASQAGMLSKSGSCRPFGAEANGLVLGEGVGCVVLKRLSAALADGDAICAVVRGFAINQDGRTNGITAPNPGAQAQLQFSTYRRFGIDPRSISYIEAHGTGTSLGDPIEIEALTSAFRKYTQDTGFCQIGSVKGNIGHTTHSAGVASVIKVLLALEHQTIPKSLGFNGPNPRIDFESSPFRVATESVPWVRKSDGPLTAALNSFGFGGTSCHVVLSEFVPPLEPSARAQPELIALSASTHSALARYVQVMRDWVQHHDIPLARVSYTLLCRRAHFRVRWTCVVRSRDELVQALDALEGADGRVGTEVQRSSERPATNEINDLCMRAFGAPSSPRLTLLQQLGEAFERGVDADWAGLFGEVRPRLARLPGQPFCERSYWPGAVENRSAQNEAKPSDDHMPAEPNARASASFSGVRYHVRSWEDAPTVTHGECRDILVYSDEDDLFSEPAFIGSTTPIRRLVQVRQGAAFRHVSDDLVEIDMTNAKHHERLWQVLSEKDFVISHVLYLCSCTDAANSLDELQVHKASAWHRVEPALRALSKHAPQNTQVLLCHFESEDGDNPAFAALEGLALSFQGEAPSLFCRVVKAPAASAGSSLASELRCAPGNESVRYRDTGQRQTAILRDITAHTLDFSERLFRSQGTYLITGGAGGLGRQLAKHLVERYEANVVLAGRRPEPAEVSALRAALGRGRVQYVQADVSTQEGVLQALGFTNQTFDALHGVLHLAGNLRALDAGEPSDVDAVLSAKLDATWLLDQATMPLPLELFLLFSSVSSVFGNPGQADYAFANSYLDHFAERRERLRQSKIRNGRTISVSLPLWKGGRLRVDEQLENLIRKTTQGGVLEPEVGLEALEGLATLSNAHVVVTCDAPGGVLAEADPHGEVQRFEPESVPMSRSEVTDWIADEVAQVLKLDRKTIRDDEHLMEYGFDSILLTDFVNRLNEQFPLDLTPASLFQHSTLAELVDHLLKQYGEILLRQDTSGPVSDSTYEDDGHKATPKRHANPRQRPQTPKDTEVAIVGIAYDLPGSNNARDYWKNIVAGRPLPAPASEERVRLAGAPLPQAGYLDDVAGFDAEFFGVTPREAKLIDPQQRRFLEIVWRTMEDAGHRPAEFAGSRTGVFVGVATSDYEELVERCGLSSEALAPTGTSYALVANRISFYFNLRGPSEPCNTACSSALVAVHRACEAIRSGACDAVIAGGVNLLLTRGLFDAFGAAGMLSESGRLRAFDAAADGYVRGEGAGAFLLKPLSKACEDGDHIYGVIRGSAVNHGGRAGTLTAPNPKAQAELLTQIYRQAGVSPDRLGYIEAHGSGTSLGDPIELNAIKTVFEELYSDWGISQSGVKNCAVSTAKGMLGHLEAAAGVAGLARVLLSLEHRQIPGNVSLSDVNPQIRLDGSPLYLPAKTEDWKCVQGKDGSDLRLGGVSSFGFGGANAHVLVEEYRPPAVAIGIDEQVVIVLSARSTADLITYAQRLADDLEARALSRAQLADLSFTSQVGRTPMPERIAIIAGNREELCDILSSFVQGRTTPERLWRGVASAESQEARDVHAWIAARDLSALCAAWVEGVEVPWAELHGPERRRMPFTTYPFARTPYWCTDASPMLSEHACEPQVERPRISALQLPEVSGGVQGAQPDAPTFGQPSEATAAPAGTSMAALANKSEVFRAQSDVVPTRAILRRALSETLHVELERIEDGVSFVEQGLDSILALEFVKCLNAELKTAHKAVILFDHPTIDALTEKLEDDLSASEQSEPSALTPADGVHDEPPDVSEDVAAKRIEFPSPGPIKAMGDASDSVTAQIVPLTLAPLPVSVEPAPATAPAVAASFDIAVVGMGAVLPDAEDVNQFWQNLRAGHCSVREVPASRWPLAVGEKARWGAFVDGVGDFDPLFFHISPEEARWMDPQQRLFLQTAWSAMEDAGYSAERIKGVRCGTMVGVMNNDYYELIAQGGDRGRTSQVMTGNAAAILAARLAYFLDLKGPALQLDCACSSSLLAVHLACRALQAGDADLMLAGGVTVYLAESSFAKMSDANMLSAAGRCFTFDQRADGFVPGEGAAVVVLKRLADARRDGEQIYGVIRGSATNQDGKTNGLTAPSAASQAELELGLYDALGIRADTIDYVEAHGTATQLGDPIEVKALTDAFRAHTNRNQFCGIGSLKTNIGHTAAAAGVAGLIKVLLALRNEQLPPSLHFEQPNKMIEFDSSPFRVVTELEPWVRRAERPRRAAISSFGFSGTNVHLVVDEAEAPPQALPNDDGTELIVLSAKNRERLGQVAKRLATALRSYGRSYRLADIAYTLQTGRSMMEARFATVASSPADLIEKLEAFARNDGEIVVPQDDNHFDSAQRFLRGDPPDWEQVGARGSIVPLPTYPFTRLHLWLRNPEPESRETDPGVDVLYDAERSAREEGRIYSVRLSATSPLLRDHWVRGELVCPGALLAALAQRVIDQAYQSETHYLQGFELERPVAVQDEARLHFLLSQADVPSIEIYAQDPSGEQRVARALVSVRQRAAAISGLELSKLKSRLPLGRADLESRHQPLLRGDALYNAARSVGLRYGPALRCVRECAVGPDELLASVEFPEHLGDDVTTQRAVGLETALQVIAAPAVDPERGLSRAEVPVRLGSLTFEAMLPCKGYVYVQRESGELPSWCVVLFDIDGRCCLQVQGVVLRPLPDTRGCQLFVPRWLPHASVESSRADAQGRTAMIVFEPDEQGAQARAAAIGRVYERQGASVRLFPRREVDAKLLQSTFPAAHPGALEICWFVSGRPLLPADTHGVTGARVNTLHAALEILQCCQAAGLADRALTLRAITRGAHAVGHDETGHPAPASVSGLLLSAAREFRHWTVQCLDMPEHADDDAIARALCSVPSSNGLLAVRRDDVYERALVSFDPPQTAQAAGAFRQGETYCIVGGLSGIGFEFAKYLTVTYAANLVLIGRSVAEDRHAELDTLRALGADPLYVVADVADPAQLSLARSRALSRFGRVDVVVHSALVLEDALVENLTQQSLHRVLTPKELGCAALFEVFRHDPLNCMIFFSSVQSFTCNAGQGNYAAASCFEDAYVRFAAATVSFPTLVVNWGFWGSVGVVATERYRHELALRGVESIEPYEGFLTLERLVTCRGQAPQAVALKGDLKALDGIRVQEEQRGGAVITSAPPIDDIKRWFENDAHDEGRVHELENDLASLEQISRHLLWCTLRDAGAFCNSVTRTEAKWMAQLGVRDKHARLFHELVEILKQGVFLSESAAGLSPAESVSVFETDMLAVRRGMAELSERVPELKAHVALLEHCAHGLVRVLQGKLDGQALLFPEGSTRLVDPVFAVATSAYYNRLAASALRGEAERRATAGEKVRVIEIGAGTGGTSSEILAALADSQADVEYFYTDASPYFVQLGQQRFQANYPFVNVATFDISADADSQGFTPASFDIIFGANVVHATADVSATLRNLKRLLKPGGMIALLESTKKRAFITMTFGLMDQWWSYVDPSVRIKGAPLLSASGWAHILSDAGFTSCVTRGLSGLEASEQPCSVMVAFSDGVVQTNTGSDASMRQPNVGRRHLPRAVQASRRPGEATADALELLKTAFEETLGIDRTHLDEDLTFDHFGVDSLMGIKLLKKLEDTLGRLPSTLLFEQRTLRSLAAYISEHYAECIRRTTHSSIASIESSDTRITSIETIVCESDIAVVGLSGRYPGSKNLEAFWDNLQHGRCSVRHVPASRWNSEHAGRDIYTQQGGFLDDVALFDPQFFGMLPSDAAALDPQARLFLETASAALEDGGYSSARLDRLERSVGVFVGAMNSDYEFMAGEAFGRGAFTSAHVAHWSIANRVSFHFDLAGPSLTVNTACSSSLTALHLAVESLRRGECSLALAGGVNLILHPVHYRRLCATKMLAPDGTCRPFGLGASGFVDGEGVGAVVLRPLRDAIQDRDHIHGIIKASAINAGGRTHGFTVPNPQAQTSVVTSALSEAHLCPEDISYVEAHGTGTPLGDPIEVAALSHAFATARPHICAIGSVKSNIGHLESAAGVAGLTKVLLSLKHQRLVPSLHTEELNPKVDFEGSPFVVQRSTVPWPSPEGTPRRAGLSSFGAGGANAHVIIEEYRPPERPRGETVPGVFLLSARRADDLVRYAHLFADYFERHGHALHLSDVLKTMQAGREHMQYRLAVFVSSIEELARRLHTFSKGDAGGEGLFTGQSEKDQRDLDPRLAVDLAECAMRWTMGTPYLWPETEAHDSYFISLPTYPFDRERCWFDEFDLSLASTADRGPETAGTVDTATMKPLHTTLARVASVAAKALKVEPDEVDVSADISKYGFDSINVMFMVSGVEMEFGVRLDPREIVAFRTLGQLAEYLTSNLAA